MAPGLPDTIVALSSGRLPAGIAIVRLSGRQTRFAVETIAGRVPPARAATYSTFKDSDGARIDSGLLLFFPASNSFTGEDCAEFHLHGGRAVVSALMTALTSLPGVRHADAGEFARRAFLNGKIDLVEAEGIADLIAAETEAQRRLSVLNAGGAQSDLYAGWRRRIIHAMAMIEAELDFADEGDVPGSVAQSVWGDVRALVGEIGNHVGGYHRAEMIRDGYDVVIVGAPNAGKSSLLNALAQREAALVSDEPGTTRDLVEVSLDLAGVKVRVTDTAGIRDNAGRVEAMGIERARQRSDTADLVLSVVDIAGRGLAPPPQVANRNVFCVGTKADLAGENLGTVDVDLLVSAVTGQGVVELLDVLGSRAKSAVGDMGDVLPSRLRHVDLLLRAAASLDASLVEDTRGLELRADDLRRAADQIGRISGSVDVEDLLDVIFSQFCVGK